MNGIRVFTLQSESTKHQMSLVVGSAGVGALWKDRFRIRLC